MKNLPSAQVILAGLALIFMGALALLLVFKPVPQPNHDYLIFILGALAGAITMSGAAKIDGIMKADIKQ